MAHLASPPERERERGRGSLDNTICLALILQHKTQPSTEYGSDITRIMVTQKIKGVKCNFNPENNSP